VGKSLSKDEKARKLALQHWLEALNRLIFDIAMATICNSIIMLGSTVTVTNPFSIGRFAIQQSKSVTVIRSTYILRANIGLTYKEKN
ncbi:hypothetical protein HID58_082516, partial [Brassica napus]